MTPWKLFRKLGRTIRGGASPGQIFLGCLLGVWIGMTPGFNLTLLTGVILLVLLNANTGIAALGFLVGKVLCLALAPVTYQIGYAVIHGAEGLFRSLAGIPVVALLDLHVYCLVGGLPVALVVGCVMGWALARMVLAARLALVKVHGRSEAVQKLGSNVVVRLLLRIAFGKQKTSLAESLESRPPLLRKGGLIATIVVVVVLLGVELLLADMLFAKLIERKLGRAAGAEVNTASAHLSLLGGSVEIAGLQVTDRDKPTHNALQISRLAGGLSISDLLTKRFVIDEMTVEGLKRDVPRTSAGEVYPAAEASPRKRPPQQTVGRGEAGEDWSHYFEETDKYREYLRKIRQYLAKRRAEKARKEEGKAPPAGAAEGRGYLSLSAANVLTRVPSWTIRKLSARDIPVPESTLTMDLLCRELSGQPELNDQPMTIEAGGPELLAVKLTFHFGRPEQKHGLRLVIPNVKITDKFPVAVRDGTVTFQAEGTFTDSALDMPFTIALKGSQTQPQVGKGLFGLDPETSAEILKSLEAVNLYGAVQGDLESPRLTFDTKRTLDEIAASLKKGGLEKLAGLARRQAQKQIEKQVDKHVRKALDKTAARLEEKTGIRLPKTLKGDALKKLLKPGKKDAKDGKGSVQPKDILKDLLPGKKDKDDGESPTSKPAKPKAKDILKQFF